VQTPSGTADAPPSVGLGPPPPGMKALGKPVTATSGPSGVIGSPTIVCGERAPRRRTLPPLLCG